MRWEEDSSPGRGLSLHVRRVVEPVAPAVLLLHGLGVSGSVFHAFARRLLPDLAVVAPGISEALIATAMGLFAAIPAVLAYNHFTHRVKLFSAIMDDFALEFLNITERNFT